MKIQTSFSFAAAHKLEDYEGDCARLHGHNYKVIIEAESEIDDKGFVVDFKKLKDIVNNELDHKTILKTTKDNLYNFSFMTSEVFFMKKNPTAENISEVIKQFLSYEQSDVNFKVTVYETDNSFAVAE